MNKLTIIIGAIAIAVLGAAAWFWLGRPAPVASVPMPVAAAPMLPSKPASAIEPAVRYPLPPAADAASDASSTTARSLPPLAKADALVQESIGALVGRRAMTQLLQTDGFIQRVVATVDNLPRRHASPKLWPVHPMAGRFSVRERGELRRVDPDNAARYQPLVKLVESVEPARAATVYRELYPLFQQAWQDLGYPRSYFNDRLVDVIDHLLTTPQLEGPIEMTLTDVRGPIPSTTPWLRYEFVDPTLRGLSSGQKMLLRTGVVNQRRLMDWLTRFRTQVAR